MHLQRAINVVVANGLLLSVAICLFAQGSAGDVACHDGSI